MEGDGLKNEPKSNFLGSISKNRRKKDLQKGWVQANAPRSEKERQAPTRRKTKKTPYCCILVKQASVMETSGTEQNGTGKKKGSCVDCQEEKGGRGNTPCRENIQR